MKLLRDCLLAGALITGLHIGLDSGMIGSWKSENVYSFKRGGTNVILKREDLKLTPCNRFYFEENGKRLYNKEIVSDEGKLIKIGYLNYQVRDNK